MFANAAAIVTDAFPREQLGLAMGTNTMVAAVGLVIDHPAYRHEARLGEPTRAELLADLAGGT